MPPSPSRGITQEFIQRFSIVLDIPWDRHLLHWLWLRCLTSIRRSYLYIRHQIREHPYLVTLCVVAFVLACCTPTILGAAGFAATGPVAGSAAAAAAWQSTIGLVQAGSLFAWCQGVAMGGAALGGVIAAGGAAGVVAFVPGVADKVVEGITSLGRLVGDKVRGWWR